MLVSLLYYFVFACILFFVNTFFNKRGRKIGNDILFYLVYLIICAGYLDAVGTSYNYIFLIVVFTMLIELLYSYSFSDDRMSFNINYFLEKYTIILISSIILEGMFLSKVTTLLPDLETMKTIIWLLVLFYLYNMAKEFLNNKQKKVKNNLLNNREYLIENYARYKFKYNYLVNDYDLVVRDVCYALMIYEAYNTPRLKRNIDNFCFGKIKNISKLGIMQVTTKNYITDEESIRLVCNALEKEYEKLNKDVLINKNKADIGYKLINNYVTDRKKAAVIVKIYNIIKSFKELK